MSKMKSKKIIILIIIVVLIISSWITLFIIDKNRLKDNKKPLIVFKSNIQDYEDGYVEEYYSLLYVVRFYNRDLIKEKEIAYALYPAKFQYISTGHINDFDEYFRNKKIGKGNFVKVTGLISDVNDNINLASYTYSVSVSSTIEVEDKIDFNNKLTIKCNKEKITYLSEPRQLDKEDEITIYGRIKRVKKNSTDLTVTLDNCKIE